MGSRRRITSSGTNSVHVPSGNSFVLPPLGIDFSGSAPSGISSSFATSAVVYHHNPSIISKEKSPEGGDIWAVIVLSCGLAAFLAFGIFTLIRAGQMEIELSSFLANNWEELDCGVGPLTIVETRKASGLLRKKIPWV